MISVVIAAYNEEANIGKCLESIKKQGDFKDYEIVVVDGESTDKTVEVAKKFTDHVLVAKTGSPGPARNLGVKNCSGDVVAFTDADTLVAGDWLRRMAEDFKDPKVVGVGGVMRPYDGRLLDRIMFKINSDLWYRLTAIVHFYQLATPNCAYTKKAFLEAGGFDESLSMLEDTELSLRMRKYGRIMIDKDLVVYNSARRFKQEGYFRVFLRYLKEYINMFLGRDIKSKHFMTIDH